jgi:hypothetical protein
VDDNRDGADSVSKMLKKLMGNDIRTAYDGQQGVWPGSTKRHALLLDINTKVSVI